MTSLGWPLAMLLIVISAVGPLTMNGVLPANSAVMIELSTRYEVVQLVLTVFLLANLISQLLMGPAADHYGRRPIMLFSLLVFVCGSLICATADSIEWLLAGRFVQGFGSAVCVFLPRTIVRDIYKDGKAASTIGYMTTAMMVAPMFGPATGGWLTDHYTWRLMYAGFAVLGLLILTLSWKFQPETLASRQLGATPVKTDAGQSFFRASFVLLRDPAFLACACMQVGAVGVYYVYLAGVPYVAIESRGLTASSFGSWFAMVAIGYLCGNLTAGRFSEKLGVQRMILLGFVPFFIGTSLFWVLLAWDHPLALFLPMLIVAYSNGMSLPSMITAAMSVRPELAASASGLAGSAQMAFGILLSLAAGYLLPSGDFWLFVLVSCSTAISLMGLWLTRRFIRAGRQVAP